jgi:hypothetical protein
LWNKDDVVISVPCIKEGHFITLLRGLTKRDKLDAKEQEFMGQRRRSGRKVEK